MKEIIEFYKNAYKSELSHSKRLHLGSARILRKFQLYKKEELLDGSYPLVAIKDEWGQDIVKTLELRENDVELVYFSGLRISRFNSMGKYDTSRAYPLFQFKANIEITPEGSFVKIDLESKKYLGANLPKAITETFIFKKLFAIEEVDFHFYSSLADIVHHTVEKADEKELRMYPELWNSRKINAYLKSEFKIEEKYVPAGFLVLLEKKDESYTTIDELTTLSQAEEFSAPLKVLFDEGENVSEGKMGIVSEELNLPQIAGLVNSNEKIISVISGPPGTGKSYTIANLAVEKVSKGESVLITSKNREALKVIEEKIGKQLGLKELCVNVTEDAQLKSLKEKLTYYLGRQYKPRFHVMEDIEKKYGLYEKLYAVRLEREKELLNILEREKNYIGNISSSDLFSPSDDFIERMATHRSKTTEPLWEQFENYYKIIEDCRQMGREIIKDIILLMRDNTLITRGLVLKSFLSFLKARNRERKKKLEELVDFETVLKAMPVWLVRANEISKVIDSRKEVFDVLIIDEASQCDIPSMLPLIQRAKKVVVVGDSNQLSHISFLSNKEEFAFKLGVDKEKRHLCKHRDYSVLDLFEDRVDPEAKSGLTEHFRSLYPIISFSNSEFYNSKLKILTQRPEQNNNAVQFVKTKGSRVKGVNKLEVELIIKEIQSIIESELELRPSLKTSIGILSPFRKQIDYIFEQIKDSLTLKEIQNHQIVVGTSYTFQGNERDLMMLSLSLDEKSVGGSFTFMNRKDVFNVAVTRAKNKQKVYYSFDPKKIKSDSVVANFFRHYSLLEKEKHTDTSKDAFCNEVAEYIHEKGLKTWKAFEISGVKIDLLLKNGDNYLGIDLIGFAGEMEDY
ncbi:MAG: hypothetical protein ACI857_000681, partial [Arenicella sp.]